MSKETAKKKYVYHNKKCYACGKPQGQMFLGYDPHTLKSYCLKNCRKPKEQPQGIELIPMTNDDFLTAIGQYYEGYTHEMLLNLLGRTVSVRMGPAHIMHLLKVAELEGIDKIQNAMINIIEHDMMERNLDHINLTVMDQTEEVDEEELFDDEPEPVVEEPVIEEPKPKAKRKKKEEPKEEVKEEEPLEDDGDEWEI